MMALTNHSLKFLLLGSFELNQNGHPAGSDLRRKTRALLAYLIATRWPNSRQSLSEMFCQESADPLGALRWNLSAIRRQLGPDVLRVSGKQVQFNPEAGMVDLKAFVRALQGDLTVQSIEELEAAVSLYRGDFLAGMVLPDAPDFELWLLGERARMQHLYERGLAHLIVRLIGEHLYESAIYWAFCLVQTNPLHEEAHQHLIWLYAQTGQRKAALAHYEKCRHLLQRELHAEPTPTLQALYKAVLSNQIETFLQTQMHTLTHTKLHTMLG
jgi:DNA-binding SARP family transcriptional activator